MLPIACGDCELVRGRWADLRGGYWCECPWSFVPRHSSDQCNVPLEAMQKELARVEQQVCRHPRAVFLQEAAARLHREIARREKEA